MNETSNPFICGVLKFIAWLCLILGIIAGIDSFNSGLVFMGISLITGGLISAVVFWAIAEVIWYLEIINSNIYWITQNAPTKKDFEKS